MEYRITGRKPERLYRLFEDISQIPRGTGNERGIADYLVGFAKERDLSWYRDELQNVLIRKPGSSGHEQEPAVLLECHSDMVCQKVSQSNHDFLRDPIELVVDGDRLRADGTTLGADNGCGMAIELFLLDDKEAVHPPLECLFCSQEEAGLVGAAHFDVSVLNARRAIGLDAGADGIFCKGTTTQDTISFSVPIMEGEPPWGGNWHLLTVTGLLGGYPALNLPLGRMNAIALLGEVLGRLGTIRFFSLESESRGLPESACAVFWSGKESSQLDSAVDEVLSLIRKRCGDVEKDLNILLSDSDPVKPAATVKASSEVVSLMNKLPLQCFTCSKEQPSLVASFSVCKKMRLAQSSLSGELFISAENRKVLDAIGDEVAVMLREFHGTLVERKTQGWEVRAKSYMREMMSETYLQLFRKRPYSKISHGSNDCVELVKKIPEMDIITTAVDCFNFHTPREYMDMTSFERTCLLVKTTLKRLAEGETAYGL